MTILEGVSNSLPSPPQAALQQAALQQAALQQETHCWLHQAGCWLHQAGSHCLLATGPDWSGL